MHLFKSRLEKQEIMFLQNCKNCKSHFQRVLIWLKKKNENKCNIESKIAFVVVVVVVCVGIYHDLLITTLNMMNLVKSWLH
jgi:hypothetical protein